MRTALSLFLSAGFLAAPAVAHAQTGIPASAAPVLDIQTAADGSHGGRPYGGFIQASDGNLYGTMQCGGAAGECQPDAEGGGAIFKITPSGAYSLIHTFSQAEGTGPTGLVQAPDGNLYGTATFGGANGYGSIYRVSLSGSLTVLYSFQNGQDASYPVGSIIYGDDGYLYGTNETQGDDPGGSLWRIKTDGTGFKVLWVFGVSGGGAAQNFGTTPYDGVEKIGSELFGISQDGATDGNGSVWSISTSGASGNVIHQFMNGADGANPGTKPHLYADGFLYGTTPQNVSTVYGGSLYKIDQTSAFTELRNSANTFYYGGIAFDNSGYLLYTSEQTPEMNGAGYGSVYVGDPAADIYNTLYTLPADGNGGFFPSYTPFLDNQGRIWFQSEEGNTFGNLVALTTTPAEAAPISLAASATSVTVGGSSSITWKAYNAFSSNEQVCFAVSSPAVTGWSGLQAGSYANGVYASSKAVSVSFPSTGSYRLSITCGGSETAAATITVASSKANTTTTLTATPNPVGMGKNITITAAVKKQSGTGAPTGSVNFMSGSTMLATATLNTSGVAALTAPVNYPNGTYPVTAVYAGDSSDNTSTSNTVNVAVKDPSTASFTVTPSSVKAGGSVTFKVAVTSTGGGTPTGSVSFSVGSTALFSADLSGGAATQTVSSSGYPAGTYTVTATYNGDANHASSSANATVTLTN